MAEIQIGDYTYIAPKLPADQALRLAMRFGKIVAPAMPHLSNLNGLTDIAALIAKKDKTPAEAAQVSDALGSITSMVRDVFMSCDPDQVTSFILEIVKASKSREPNGSMVTTPVSSLTLPEMLQIFWLMMRENFADFFGSAASAVTGTNPTRPRSAGKTFDA